MTRQQKFAQLLVELTEELKRIDLWQLQPPSPEALASTQPFCIDTLSLSQWLQFIFIPKLSALINHHQPLPEAIGIAPLAEQVYLDDLTTKAELIRILRAIDDC